MIAKLRSSLRFLYFCRYAAEFVIRGSFNQLSSRNDEQKRKQAAKLIQRSATQILNRIGVDVVLKDRYPDQAIKNGQLIACNHMGYLDVLILASRFPGVFVTSVEVRNTPFLGLLSKIGGCLYVERRSREGLSVEVQEMTQALKQGFSVLFFPEATSTNADEVLRFRRPLFQAAVDAGAEVLPLTINYISINGRSFQRANRDAVCWYGDMPFLGHLLNLFAQKEVTVLITKHESILSLGTTKEILAEKSHAAVSGHFIPCPRHGWGQWQSQSISERYPPEVLFPIS